MKCLYCGSIEHDESEILVNVCQECYDAMGCMAQEYTPSTLLKNLIELGWICQNPKDKAILRNEQIDKCRVCRENNHAYSEAELKNVDYFKGVSK